MSEHASTEAREPTGGVVEELARDDALKPGQTARFTLSKPGVYAFYCQFHAFMTGTIKIR
jgi:plastocyanin